MNSLLSAVHPELQEIIKIMPQRTYSAQNLWFWRLRRLISWGSAKPGDIHIENMAAPDPEHGRWVRVRVYRPIASVAPLPGLIWLHGGGFILGKPALDDALCAEYVRALGIVIVSVDYRYAPQHPFPAALDDSYAAAQWVYAQARELGIDARRIALGGASAGGGLAAALAQYLLDRKAAQPVFQLLVYPMLDDRTSARRDGGDIETLAWTQGSNRFGWESYLGQPCGAASAPPYSVPARRADLSGLPPAWIGVGTLDLFHAEDVAYAQRLQDCGVACELCVVPGAFHGFDTVGPQPPVVQAFRNSQLAALRRALFPKA